MCGLSGIEVFMRKIGTIQIDRIKEMKKDARNFKKDSNGGNLSGIRYRLSPNNHYAGFVTGTVKIFRQLLGLEEVKWGDDFIATNDLDKEDNHCRVNGKKNKI